MSSEDIIFNEKKAAHGFIGEAILNRPNALNALTLEMCQQFYDQLNRWQENDDIKAVIIKGVGDRAFCAGGDIRKLYENKNLDSKITSDFFWHEYRLNALIHHFPKPYFALLHHITMGGGAGVSINGAYRLAAENLVFAMPETKIGFYPDIGASYFLNQCPGKTGLYLALTGNSINAATAYKLGLITHILPQNKFESFEAALLNAKTVSSTLFDPYVTHTTDSNLDPHIKIINDCFSEDSVAQILQKLETQNDWAKHIAQQLKQRSPTSLKVTFDAYRRAEEMPFDEIMQMNFDVTQRFLDESDFFEGVRAAIIDKDQTPHWQSEIFDTDIAAYFTFKGKKLFE